MVEQAIEHGDPNSKDARFHKAMTALYLEVPEEVARHINEVIYDRYVELKCELAEALAKLAPMACGHPRFELVKGNLHRTDDGDCAVCILHGDLSDHEKTSERLKTIALEAAALLRELHYGDPARHIETEIEKALA